MDDWFLQPCALSYGLTRCTAADLAAWAGVPSMQSSPHLVSQRHFDHPQEAALLHFLLLPLQSTIGTSDNPPYAEARKIYLDGKNSFKNDGTVRTLRGERTRAAPGVADAAAVAAAMLMLHDCTD
jgi:hypothetical protein